MSDFKYSPVEVKDKILDTFPDVSFFQPYITGTFDNDPKYGRIKVGVRTPWYDISYLELHHASFWNECVNETGLKNILKAVANDIDAAITIQNACSANGVVRLDKTELGKYHYKPEEYIYKTVRRIESRRKSEVHTKIVAVEPDPKDIIDKGKSS